MKSKKADRISEIESPIGLQKVPRNSKSPSHAHSEARFIPTELNLHRYADRSVSYRLMKGLYQDPEKRTPTTEFLANLIIYYTFLLCFLLSLLGFALLMHGNNSLSTVHLNVHIACIAALIVPSAVFLILVSRFEPVLLRSRVVLLTTSFCTNLYLIFADERVLSKITAEPKSETQLPLSLGLVCMMFVSRIVLYDYYFYVFIIGMSSSFIFLITQLSYAGSSPYSVLTEIALICLFSLIEIGEARRSENRLKQIFSRKEVESKEAKIKSTIKDIYLSPGINTEAEHLLGKCEDVISNLKHVSQVIIYKDIKKMIKQSMNDLENIKVKIVHSGLENARVEISPMIDEEDRQFIAQNYMDISSIRSSVHQPTISDISDNKSPLFQNNYSLAEWESVLASIGKTWSFDIFFVYNSTGHSISIVGKFLFTKWKLCDMAKLNETETSNFFKELESVQFT
jgi:hypothetical protein